MTEQTFTEVGSSSHHVTVTIEAGHSGHTMTKHEDSLTGEALIKEEGLGQKTKP